jgi:hypothetical protein
MPYSLELEFSSQVPGLYEREKHGQEKHGREKRALSLTEERAPPTTAGPYRDRPDHLNGATMAGPQSPVAIAADVEIELGADRC